MRPPTRSFARFAALPWLLCLALNCSEPAGSETDSSPTDAGADADATSGGTVGAPGSGGASGNASGGTAQGSGGASGGSPADDVYYPDFILGADISITLEDESWGATYTDVDGVVRPLEEILKRHGFNYVRIDTFVNPSAGGGYASGKAQPFRNLAQTITLAKRIKAQGLGFLLDLHLSDTWTNPTAQGMPAAWLGLTGTALETALHDYVSATLQALRDAGARPDMVQVGNEVTNGFLWEAGRITSNDFSGFAKLLKAGISAVREIDPRIVVLLHIEKCNNLATSRWWLDGVLGEGVEFDVLGQSCYAPVLDEQGAVVHPGYQGDPEDWVPVFETLAEEYPGLDFIAAEYSAEQRAVNDVLFALPAGRGRGSFNWDPTRAYETHPNVPLFEAGDAWNDYLAIPELLELYDQMAQDYGLTP